MTAAPKLLLGPIVRGTAPKDLTVWVELDRPCKVDVNGTRVSTFCIAGHHYALVPLRPVTPDVISISYSVIADGSLLWPPPEIGPSAATIALPVVNSAIQIAGGSCRQQAPEPLWFRRKSSSYGDLGPDALATLAHEIESGVRPAPHLILLTGDQVYADEKHESVECRLAIRRGGPPEFGRPDVTSFEEYTWLYQHTWAHPKIRRLLATVPSLMVFDDHDIIDDWNTSQSWAAEMSEKNWWSDRVISGLMAYWVYQHVGNLSSAQRSDDPLFAAISAADDGAEVLETFCDLMTRNDAPKGASWSYSHTLDDRLCIAVVDSRCGRVLDPDSRSVLSPYDWRWLEQLVKTTPAEHLLVVTSVPWLLPDGIQRLERRVSSLINSDRGFISRVGEFLRQAVDLEHWAAFGNSARRLAAVLDTFQADDCQRGSVTVLSGDVHFAYTAELPLPSGRIANQVVASPLRQSEYTFERAARRIAMSRFCRRLLRRHADLAYDVTNGPWFRNNVAHFSYTHGAARARISQARTRRARSHPKLETVFETALTRQR